MPKVKQKDLPRTEKNSRSFSFRLSLKSDDPDHVNARKIANYMWDEVDNGTKTKWLVRVFNEVGVQENISDIDYVENLSTVSDKLLEMQDKQASLLQALEQERDSLRSLVRNLRSLDFESVRNGVTQVIDSTDGMNPDLEQSLLSLLDE